MKTATVIPERLERIQREKIKLRAGAGPKEPNGDVDGCVMQVVAYVAGEPWTDHPVCASPLLTSFCIAWNDALDDKGRQRLVKFIPRLVGTAGDAKAEERRAWMATDWLVRTFASAWLRLAGLDEYAAKLESLKALTSTALAKKAQPIIEAARSAAYLAADSAAYSAARSAARSAAYSALAPTVAVLQDSAEDLLDRMIEA